jgi:Holliday junction resolvase
VRLDDVPREGLLAVAALAVLFAWLVVVVPPWLRRARMRRRFARGAEGEREAIAILEDRGFTIEGAQVVGTYALDVDGVAFPVRVIADYIVARNDVRFVAEVKTGRLAPRLETASTRRQLLEYEHAFDVSGVLLVDADARTVRRIEFRRSPRARRWGAWAVAVLLAVAVAVGKLVL